MADTPSAQGAFEKANALGRHPLAGEMFLLERIRSCLKRWAARYAEAPHAQEHVKETKLLIQEIEERLLANGGGQVWEELQPAHAREHICDQGFGCPICAATQDPKPAHASEPTDQIASEAWDKAYAAHNEQPFGCVAAIAEIKIAVEKAYNIGYAKGCHDTPFARDTLREEIEIEGKKIASRAAHAIEPWRHDAGNGVWRGKYWIGAAKDFSAAESFCKEHNATLQPLHNEIARLMAGKIVAEDQLREAHKIKAEDTPA